MDEANETTYTIVSDDDKFSSHIMPESAWEADIINRTENVTKIDYFYFYEKEQLAMLWILFVSIIFGNCSVLITLLFSKVRGSRFRYFIKHLAIADLSVGLVSVMTDIIWKFTVEWKAGNVACKIVKYSQVVVTYSSTYVMVALTIDRYDAIRHPMNFSKGWKRAKKLVLTAWLLSFLFSSPIIILYEEKNIEGHLQCWIDLLESWHWQIYMTLISLTVFFIPACIIATCYSIIIYTIWSKTNILSQTRTPRHNVCEVSELQKEDTDCRRVSSRGLIPKAKIKTIKMTLIIVFVFIFCWSPYMIFDLLQVFGYIEKTQSNIALATFIQSLAPLNSAANPIIYCIFSTIVCRVRRKSLPLQCLTKWCYHNAHLGTGRKISDTITFSNVTGASTKKYVHFPRSDNQFDLNKKIDRSSGTRLKVNAFPSRGTEVGGKKLVMTLKNQITELSERAKAFSVENLINGADPGNREAFEEIARRGNQIRSSNGITTELCGSDLWRKFSDIGTEMIVTKAGRRMFPTLKVRFHGLTLTTTYIVYMDIIPVGETRYRYIYHSSQWMAAGASETHSENNVYIHPDSPATGQLWISQGHISFDKIKLTNNRRPIMAGQISLQSMHKYQPRIHILEVPISDNLRLNTPKQILDYIRCNRERTASFTFERTTFITVTAYQNQEITKLKIQSNPFAKGFRETAKPREDGANNPISVRGCLPSAEGYRSAGVSTTFDRERDSFGTSPSREKAQRIPLKLVIPPIEMREIRKPHESCVNFFLQ